MCKSISLTAACLILAIFPFSSRALATWSVGTNELPAFNFCKPNTTSCTILFAPIGSGSQHLIVCEMTYGGSVSTSQKKLRSCTDDGAAGGSTYSHPLAANCAGYDGLGHSTDCMVALVSASGIAHVTCNTTAAGLVAWSCSATELITTASSASVDASGNVKDPIGNHWPGVPLTITGNDAIVQLCRCGPGTGGVTSPLGTNYGSNAQFADHTGLAISINTTIGTAPTWSNSGVGETAAGSAIAFKESSVASP
jgi:hypothetical protein